MLLGRRLISRIRGASITKIAKAVNACVESLEDRVFFSGTILRPDHIVVVVNQDRFSEALVSPSMPYTQSIAASGLVYTDSHGVTHPSEPNLLALYSGSTQGVTTNDQGYSFP